MPDKTIVSHHYQGEAGSRYFEHHQSDGAHAGYELNLAYFKPYLESGDVVLDFGCGNGGMLHLLAGCVGRAEGSK